MRIHAVFCVDATQLEYFSKEIEEKYPNDLHINVGIGQWLIAADILPRALYDSICGPKDESERPTTGRTVMVTGVDGYYGWHRSEIWEWMKLKGEASAG